MDVFKCTLKEQGLEPGSCLVKMNGKRVPACRATLRYEHKKIYRLITSIHLSPPEKYLFIYQSGCNFSCRRNPSFLVPRALALHGKLSLSLAGMLPVVPSFTLNVHV
ncbi:MAG: hypothetical protein ABIN18_07670 [Pseudomonadota bacterium]